MADAAIALHLAYNFVKTHGPSYFKLGHYPAAGQLAFP
jgi:hypothetical protein